MVLENKKKVIHSILQRERAAPNLSVSREMSGKRQGKGAFQAGPLRGGKSFQGLLMLPSILKGSLIFAATAAWLLLKSHRGCGNPGSRVTCGRHHPQAVFIQLLPAMEGSRSWEN